MFYKSTIINNNLYLYITNLQEISNDSENINKKKSIYEKVTNYIKNKGIEYNGNKVYLVINGIVIGEITLKNNKEVEEMAPMYNYVKIFTNIKDNIEILDVNINPSSKFISIEKNKDIINKVIIEQYVLGVLASEIPLYYQDETLKCQAILIRTYALNKINNNDIIKNVNINKKYYNIDELKELWEDDFNKNFRRLQNIIYETRGLYLEYNNKPIEIFYHKKNNGLTQDSLSILGRNIPYVKKLESPYDLKQKTIDTSIISYNDLSILLKQEITTKTIIKQIEINKVLFVKVGRKKYNIIDFTNLLRLRSEIFIIEKNMSSIIIKTLGLGSCLGMSQYGANEMAKANYNYQHILSYYYPKTNLKHI